MITYKKQPNTEEEIFRILHPIVKEWFVKKFGGFCLTQLYGVMEIHSRNNVLISATTGSGKTLTAFLAILNELIDSSEKEILENKIYCVYVSPLKSLNNDIYFNLVKPLEEMEKIAGKKFGIRIAVRTGDTSQSERAKMLKRAPHILITTPETLAIILSSIKFREHLKNVEWCIIDEIHALADNKRGVHLSLSLERLNHLSNYITRIGLSATCEPLEEIAKFLVGIGRSCKIVKVEIPKNMDFAVLTPVKNLVETNFVLMHNSFYKLLDQLIQSHKTTLIFTNTRSATERVVHYLKEKFPKIYSENIGAHHGSLSKELRLNLEKRMREGKLKAIVCSTSLELGIDIGYIDLVVQLGSPKSVARAVQRQGRAGHRLNDVIKGRIIVLDRDDLVECAVLQKDAVERKIDRIHIPQNCLDVLAQHIVGMAIDQVWEEKELFNLIRKSYCYRNLDIEDFNNVLSYLAGEHISLEDRHVYAKIWRKDGKIGRRGKLNRVIYMTNIGTIPDETLVKVKLNGQTIGTIDEAFLERLRRGDIFLLGGQTYKFLYSRGMVAHVSSSVDRPPTVPSWFSEMLPLNFDLAKDIGKFRRLVEEKLKLGKKKNEIVSFIKDYLHLKDSTALAIYDYINEQYSYCREIPSDKKIVIEHTQDENGEKVVVFHTLFGRRVNDCLSRAVAYAIGKTQHRDVELGINDNGFYITLNKNVDVVKAFKLLNSENLRKVMELAIEKSEILKRRFRHCAARSFMILRYYKGRKKRVGRQQLSSMLLLNAVKRISDDFPILKEARREVLEDVMDVENAKNILKGIEDGSIKVKEIFTKIPSPFALNLVMQGRADLMRIEERTDFLKRMHNYILAKIGLKK